MVDDRVKTVEAKYIIYKESLPFFTAPQVLLCTFITLTLFFPVMVPEL